MDSIERTPRKSSQALRILANRIEAGDASDFFFVYYDEQADEYVVGHDAKDGYTCLLGAIETTKLNLLLENSAK